MTAYFLFNTTQLKWADILCRMSLMVHISSAISFLILTAGSAMQY